MEEKKHDCEQPKSKRYLAFYIIGLFSVAACDHFAQLSDPAAGRP